MAIDIDLDTTRPVDAFLTILNDWAKTSYTLSDITVGDISLVGNNPSTVSALVDFAGGPLAGSRYCNWSRLDIGLYVEETPIEITGLSDGENTFTTTSQFTALINTTTGLELQPEDVLDEAINPAGWTYPHQLEVKVKTDSLVWYGKITVTVNEGPPQPSRFYLAINNASLWGTDLLNLSETEGTIVPDAPFNGDYATVGGDNDDIYYLSMLGRFCFSNNGGQTFVFEKTIEDFNLNVRHMVFFKGKLYVFGHAPNDAVDPYAVFQLTPIYTEGSLTDINVLKVRPTGSTDSGDHFFVTNADYIVMCTATTATYHYSSDGLSWSEVPTSHPWSHNYSSEFTTSSGCFVGNKLVLAGTIHGSVTQAGIYWKRPVFAVGDIGQPLTHKQTLNPPEYPSNNWSAGYQMTLGVIGSTIFLMLREVEDNNAPGAFPDSYGDLFKSADLGETWETVLYNTGIQLARWVYNGHTAVFTGYRYYNQGEPNFLTYSQDQGVSWNLLSDTDSPFYDGPYRGEYLACRNYVSV